MSARGGREEIAVSLHDVEPATFTRCALIRDWLDDHGIDRVTLLVIPAPDLHPLGDRSEALVAWLDERRGKGDAIAQHGLRDRCSRPQGWTARAPFRAACSPDAEFACLDADETRRAVESGWRILRLAGLEPQGFVAPAFAYTPALHAVLPNRFSWWAGIRRLYRPGGPAQGADVGPGAGDGNRVVPAARDRAMARAPAGSVGGARAAPRPQPVRPRAPAARRSSRGGAPGRTRPGAGHAR